MAGRTTDFPDGPRIKAFRACVDIVREDPVLSTRLKTLSAWDGSPSDKSPVTPDKCPYLQMSPVTRPNQPNGERNRLAALGISMKIAVAGLVAEDLVNFWDAIEDCFARNKAFRDTTVYCHLQGLAVWQLGIESPGLDAWKARGKMPDQFLMGEGSIVLQINRTA